MNPRPRYNFPVNVEEDVEEGTHPAELYHDIFRVTLNDCIEVMFVPEFNWQTEAWPPPVTQSCEGQEAVIATVQQARRVAAEWLYTVTPNAQMAGKTLAFESEGFVTPDGQVFGPSPNIMFCVTPQEFAHFLDELHSIDTPPAGVMDNYGTGVPVSQLQQYDVVKYLLEQVITSPCFQERDRYMLGR